MKKSKPPRWIALSILLCAISLPGCDKRPEGPVVTHFRPSPVLLACAPMPQAPVPLTTYSQAISYAVDLHAAADENCSKLEAISALPTEH